MSPAVRRGAFLVAGGVLAALLAWGFGALPHFGSTRGVYGAHVNRDSVPARQIGDAVTAAGFDYRGLDSLVEDYIFFAAVLGVILALRLEPGERSGPVLDAAPGRRVPATSDAVRVLGLGLTPPTVLFALYLVAHGQVSPGGGFQGGTVLATGVLLIFLAGEFEDLHGLYREPFLERAQALGAGAFVAVGLLGIASGGAFLANVLPKGRVGSVLSGGTIPLLDAGLAIEVSAGLVLILVAFLRQAVTLRSRPEAGRP